jgi:tryptophan synthase, alpha subunit
MAATNLLLQFGYERFFKAADNNGCDGLIMPDCSIEMAQPILSVAKEYDCSIIQLISPLCTQERLEKIVKAAEGFIYLISSKGITGERQSFSSQLKRIVNNIKRVKDIPVAVGFGVSTRKQCEQLYEFVDAAIVGSFFTSIIAANLQHKKTAQDELTKAVRLLCGN